MQSYMLDVQFSVSSSEDCNDDRETNVVPLVVNTMGWPKGLGADLLNRVHEAVQPTHIYDLQSAVDSLTPSQGVYF